MQVVRWGRHDLHIGKALSCRHPGAVPIEKEHTNHTMRHKCLSIITEGIFSFQKGFISIYWFYRRKLLELLLIAPDGAQVVPE